VSGLGPAALPTAIASRGPQLMLEFAGNSIPINKPRFVIGRGKQGIDLTIKDPNISRQHAMVELTEGRYFLLDLGSTNGVLLGGARVARRAIEDGDEFRICGHTLRFTYQPGS
jgi:pSer/pThr/pTyr-binding forkhead associated (FHA) protein